MSEEYILVRDIIYDHNERMLNIKKYYPYFKLAENAFALYQGGAYADLDMGYILMAVLRFFIEENNFKEKDVSYPEYTKFMSEILRRDFDLEIDENQMSSLCLYIFDKILNDGRPFTYEYFDPQEKKRKNIRMKLIESRIKDDMVSYYISSDAIEFYLDTKEIKDESSISVAQILLGKMISSRNFKGGIEVIRRINNEVGRLKVRKNEVLSVLSQDVFEGIRIYEDFVDHVMSWFEDEQKLYHKNMEMIEQLLQKTDDEYKEAFADIYQLETELKKSISKHTELLGACTDLQIKADEIINNAKFSRLRRSFDFKHALKVMMDQDDTEPLSLLIKPMLALNIKKSFSFTALDKMLTSKPEAMEKGDVIEADKKEEMYVYEDEIEDERIESNYGGFILGMFDMLLSQGEFTLYDLNTYFTDRYGEDFVKNGDYYSFLIHLSQKKKYVLAEVLKKPDTFFEEHLERVLKTEKKEEFDSLEFELEFEQESTIKLMDFIEITNIRFKTTKRISEVQKDEQ